jgi:hypothetical protein
MTCKDCTWFYRGDCTASVAVIDKPNLTDIKHVGEDGKTCRKFEQRMTAKKESPCRDCDHRSAGCHAECAVYKDWKEEASKQKKAEKQKAVDEYRYNSYKQLTRYRVKKARE